MFPLVLVGLTVALVALSSSSSSRGASRAAARPGRTTGDYHATTVAYARAKLQALTTRGFTGPLARALQDAYMDYVRHILPGVPYSAWIAMGASTEGQRDVVERAPYPTGWWGVERAVITRELRDAERARNAPRNNNTSVEGHDVDYASLDGAATLEEWMDSPVAQSSTAARRFRSALTVLARRLARTPWGAEVFSFTTWSTWEYQCAIAVYSAGEGATFAYLEAARAELVRMGLWDSFRSRPKDQRWSLLANAVWGIPNRRGQTQTNAWVMIRPRERLECARELAATREDGATLLWSRGDPRWPEEFDREVSAVAFGGDPVR